MAEIVVRSLSGLQQQVIDRTHSHIADEPAEYDGDDLGPDPYGLLLAALGGCTNMTLLMYSRRKDLPLTGIETRLRNDRVYGEDCRRCEEEDEYVDSIERHITLRGPLTDEHAIILGRVAAHCPVHKTLTRGLVVRDTVVRDSVVRDSVTRP